MVGVRLGVGCPCPPIRNDIVTLRHLFLLCEGERGRDRDREREGQKERDDADDKNDNNNVGSNAIQQTCIIWLASFITAPAYLHVS